jgi:hypothetical protein
VGGTYALGAIQITGKLDLNAAILNGASAAGAASLSVSDISDLGANVTTSSTQTTLNTRRRSTNTRNSRILPSSNTEHETVQRSPASFGPFGMVQNPVYLLLP